MLTPRVQAGWRSGAFHGSWHPPLICWCRNVYMYLQLINVAAGDLSWKTCSLYMQRAGAFPGRPHAFRGRLRSLLFVDFYTTQYVYINIFNVDTNTYISLPNWLCIYCDTPSHYMQAGWRPGAVHGSWHPPSICSQAGHTAQAQADTASAGEQGQPLLSQCHTIYEVILITALTTALTTTLLTPIM